MRIRICTGRSRKAVKCVLLTAGAAVCMILLHRLVPYPYIVYRSHGNTSRDHTTQGRTPSSTANNVSGDDVVSDSIGDGITSDNEFPIPKILHFVWDTLLIPTCFRENIKSFYTNHPDWTFYLWTFSSSRQMLADKAPDVLVKYNHYGAHVFRCDAIRYALLYEYGGAYFDIDTWSIKPLDDVIRNHSAVLCPEPIEHSAILYKQRVLISSASLLARPRHAFFKQLMNALPLTGDRSVLNAVSKTGPKFITAQYEKFMKAKESRAENNDVDVVSSEYFQDNVDPGQYTTITRYCRRPPPVLYRANYTLKGADMSTDACDSWKAHGGGLRRLSPNAYTKHTWFHVYLRKVPIGRFNISDVISNIKIYPDL